MASVTDVYDILSSYGDMMEYQPNLKDVSEKALRWVTERLKDGVDENDPLIAETAAAVAHYNMFFIKLTESDKYESYKAGDLTIRRNIQKELQCERELRDQALASASHIMKDGGFCFIGN